MQAAHPAHQFARAISAGARTGRELLGGVGEPGVLGGAVPVEGAPDALGVGHHALGALDQSRLLLRAVEAVGDLLDALRSGRSPVAQAPRGGGQAGVLGGAVAVHDGAEAARSLAHPGDIAGHPSSLLAQALGLRIIGVALGEAARGLLQGVGQRGHAGILRSAVALHEPVDPAGDLLHGLGIGDHALRALGEAGLLGGAGESVGRLLGALAELRGALRDTLRGGDQAGVLGGAVARDRGPGLGDTVRELLDAGGELVRTCLKAWVLRRAVTLHAGGEQGGAIEQAGLAVGAVHPLLQSEDSLGEILAARGQLIEAVGERAGPVGRLPGAVGEGPHPAGELASTLGCGLAAVGEGAGALGELLGALVQIAGALGELLCAVGGVAESLAEVVEAEVEAIEILLRHLTAHGGGGGLGDRGAHQRVDLAAGIVGGDLEDRLGGLGGADRRQILGEVLRDHDHGGVGAVLQALLGVLLCGELPVEAGGVGGVLPLDGAGLGQRPGQQPTEGDGLDLAVGILDLGALIEVHDGGRHRVQAVHPPAERPHAQRRHQQRQHQDDDQGAGMRQAVHARAPSGEEAVSRVGAVSRDAVVPGDGAGERWTDRASRRRGSRRLPSR